MPTRSLPPRPDLGQLKRQAKELHLAHAERKLPAAARIAANHPRLKGRPLPQILDAPLKLADAQLVIACEYGFDSWARLKERVERGQRTARLKPHPRFEEALAGLRDGDVEHLRGVLAREPDLIEARGNLE